MSRALRAGSALRRTEETSIAPHIAGRSHAHPDGTERRYALGTIDRWIRAWRAGGLEATMKLTFATMIRAAQRWCRVSGNDLERRQLALLRADLGLDPPPADDQAARSRRTPNRPGAA